MRVRRLVDKGFSAGREVKYKWIEKDSCIYCQDGWRSRCGMEMHESKNISNTPSSECIVESSSPSTSGTFLRAGQCFHHGQLLGLGSASSRSLNSWSTS
jgi:hypothetical protein